MFQGVTMVFFLNVWTGTLCLAQMFLNVFRRYPLALAIAARASRNLKIKRNKQNNDSFAIILL